MEKASTSKRIPSCTHCKRDKVKCDRNFPCSRCIEKEWSCALPVPTPRKKSRSIKMKMYVSQQNGPKGCLEAVEVSGWFRSRNLASSYFQLPQAKGMEGDTFAVHLMQDVIKLAVSVFRREKLHLYSWMDLDYSEPSKFIEWHELCSSNVGVEELRGMSLIRLSRNLSHGAMVTYGALRLRQSDLYSCYEKKLVMLLAILQDANVLIPEIAEETAIAIGIFLPYLQTKRFFGKPPPEGAPEGHTLAKSAVTILDTYPEHVSPSAMMGLFTQQYLHVPNGDSWGEERSRCLLRLIQLVSKVPINRGLGSAWGSFQWAMFNTALDPRHTRGHLELLEVFANEVQRKVEDETSDMLSLLSFYGSKAYLMWLLNRKEEAILLADHCMLFSPFMLQEMVAIDSCGFILALKVYLACDMTQKLQSSFERVAKVATNLLEILMPKQDRVRARFVSSRG